MQKTIVTICALAVLGLPVCTKTEMNSADYTIYADSVNTGGIFSTGAQYSLQDTIGETGIGIGTGGIMEVRGGYQAMTRGSVSLTLSNSNVNLGTLSKTVVASAQTMATVYCDDESGYSLSIASVQGAALPYVTDGSVTAGSEEYGLSATGPDSAFFGDQGVTGGLLLASSLAPVDSSETMLDFKAAISPSTPAGTYSQNISLVASANF